jgi:hypothetical protein
MPLNHCGFSAARAAIARLSANSPRSRIPSRARTKPALGGVGTPKRHRALAAARPPSRGADAAGTAGSFAIASALRGCETRAPLAVVTGLRCSGTRSTGLDDGAASAAVGAAGLRGWDVAPGACCVSRVAGTSGGDF